MKRSILLGVILSFSTILHAQTGKMAYNNVLNTLKSEYNHGQYDSIYEEFAPTMQKALNQKQTEAFFGHLKNTSGNLQNATFLNFVGTYANYKAAFQNSTLKLSFSLNADSKIDGLTVRPFRAEDSFPEMARNVTPMKLPFDGRWTVIWGGDTRELNYHVESQQQKNAFDIVMMDSNHSTHKADGSKETEYKAYAQKIYAPCDGEVVTAIDGVKDNIPGEMNGFYIPGNMIVIRTSRNEYLYFCHLKEHSVNVKEGQKVKAGQMIGLCGNSGHTTEPHLHFHIENCGDLSAGTGVKCFFSNIDVNGKEQAECSPIKGDVISNVR
jgi:murein DD-endopeptidase MepM/ murein hydrolase activator NlpD